MSVALVSEPSGVKHLRECILFTFSKTAPPDGTQSFIGYQLFDSANNPITELEAVDPGLNNYPVDFAREIAGRLRTEWHLPAPGVGADGTIRKEFYVKYGEITSTEVDGVCEVVEDITYQTANVVVVGSYPQYDDVLPFATGAFLSKRPLRYWLCNDSEDAIWVYGPGTVNYTAIYRDAPDETTGVVFAGTGVNIIPMTHVSLGGAVFTPGMWKMKIEIILTSETRTYTIYLRPCCCDYDHTEAQFKEPLGSFSTLTFECIGDAQVQWEGGIICRGIVCNPNSVPHPDGGNITISNYRYKIANRKSSLRLQLKRDFASKVDAMKWLSMLMSSDEAYVWMTTTAGTRQRCVILFASGSANIYERNDKAEFTITGVVILQD